MEAAPRLIGCLLRHETAEGVVAGRIVETEAYTHDDPSSHSFRGETPRNASMFGPAGTAYVYLIYGVHFCFNVATGPEGRGEAVLVRGMLIEEGVGVARERRGGAKALADGPGKLCQALGIGREHDGVDLLAGGRLALIDGVAPRDGRIVTTPRIGISRAVDWPRRFLWQSCSIPEE